MNWEKYTGKKSEKRVDEYKIPKGSADVTHVIGGGPTGEKITIVEDPKAVGFGAPVIGTYPTVRHYASWSDVQLMIAGQAIKNGDLVAYKSDDTVVPVLTQEEITPTFDEIWSDIRQAWSNEHIHRSEATIEVAMIKEAIHVLFDRLMDEMDARTPTDEE